MPTTPVGIIWAIVVGTIAILGLTGTVIVITIRNQRKQLDAEREKREVIEKSAAKYADLFHNVSDIIFIHQLSGEIQEVNEAVTRELNYEIDEVIGKPIQTFVPPEHNPFLPSYLENLRASGRFEGYVSIRAKNGEIKIFEYRNTLVKEENKPIAVRGIARNVTEHHVAEQKLKQSEERYRRFFEEDLTGDYIVDASGKILACNPAFASIFGFESVVQALEYNFSALYYDPAKYKHYMKRVKNEKRLVYYERELRRKDNNPVFVVENAIGNFDEAGNLVQIRGYIFDDTERKKLEEQFLQAQKMQGIGILAGGVAHDFNNILSIVMGHVSLLGDEVEEEDENVQNSIEAIDQAVRRGANLVEQILTFARKTEIIFTAVDVNEIIRELHGLLTGTFPKTITFSLELAPTIPYINADQTQLHQSLLNLCVNARDAMPGGGKISVSTSQISGHLLHQRFPDANQEGHYIQIAVSDTGSGIPENIREHLFEPFFTTKTRGQGTGLGLSVVYGVITSHFGFIDVESQPDAGTTFYLYFPCVAREVKEEQHKKPSTTISGDETILVIEDEDMLVDLLNKIFPANGYKVLTARDGLEAVEMYREHHDKIDLVFTDSGLPKLGGWETFCRIREINPNVLGVFASGYFEPGLKKDLQAFGVTEFIQKPYSPINVVRIVRSVLDRHAALESK